MNDKTETGKIHYGWIILGISVIIVFGGIGLARLGYTMILPSMQKGLEINNTQAGALATGNFIGYLSLALIGGFLASHFNPRYVIILSLFTVGITLILTGMSKNFTSAFVWRVITGMGSGGCFVPLMGLLAGWFAAKRRGFATGIAVGGTSLGLILTGILVPVILNLFGENGWRYCWFFLGAIVIAIAIPMMFLLSNKAEDRGLRPIGIESETNSSTNTSSNDTTEKYSGISSWALIYKSYTVWHLAFIYTSFGFSYIVYITFFAKYLQSEVGYDKLAAGNLWQLVGWISIFCGIIWGWFSDVFGRKYGLALVLFLQGTAYLFFAVWRAPLGITLSAIFFGLTAWSIPAIMASACADHLGAKLSSAALGFITLFFGIGQAAGPTIGGWLADIRGSFTLSFLFSMTMAYIGVFASLALKKTH